MLPCGMQSKKFPHELVITGNDWETAKQDACRIEDNHIHHINCMQELAGAETAGIKLHAAIDVIFRRNHIHHTIMGIWCDWEAQGTRITQNFFHDNQAPSDDIQPVEGGMPSQDELDGGRFWTKEEILENMGKEVFTPNFENEYKKYFM